jgi:hypothetical protein
VFDRSQEDPSVAPVEALLDGVAKRLSQVSSRARRPAAKHALWICACWTLDDAPTWLIYEDADGGVVWGRIPGGDEASDFVDAQFTAGGHADPGGVLAWLQGRAADPWTCGDGWGDEVVISELGRRIRGS